MFAFRKCSQMGRVHYLLLVVLVLYFPLRVKPGPIKDGDVTSRLTNEPADSLFRTIGGVGLYR